MQPPIKRASFLSALWPGERDLDPAEAAEIWRQQESRRAKRLPMILFGSVVNTVITAAVFWTDGPKTFIVGWLAFSVVAACLRLLVMLREKRQTKTSPPESSRTVAAWSIVAGVIWGIAAFVLFGHGSQAQHVFLAFVVGGMGAAAVASLSFLPLACIGFVIPSLPPLIVAFALEGAPLSWAMAAILALYLAALVVFTRDGYADFLDSVYARLENVALLGHAAQAQQRLSEALETMSEGFALFDADDRLVLCNQRYRSLFDDGSGLVVPGTRLEDILREGDVAARQFDGTGSVDDWIEERMRRHRNPGQPYEVQLSNGRWLRIDERRTRDGGTVGVRVDITEIKAREAELRAKSSLLESTLESIEQGVVVLDSDMRIVTWNDRFVRMFDFPPELCYVGAPARDLLSFNLERGEYGETDLDSVLEQRAAKVRAGKSERSERRRPDGRVFEITRNPMPDGGMVNTFTDITERRRAEGILRQALIFENISDAVVLMDHTGRIIDWNPAAETVFGYQRGEMLGKTGAEYSSPDDRDAFARRVDAAAEHGQGWSGERRFVRKDGSGGIAETVILPLQNEAGQSVGVIEVDHDITGRKTAEEEQARLTEQFHQAQKMEAVGTLAGGIAHDFNNILGIIIGYAEFGLESAPPDGPIATSMQQVLSAGLRARGLVGQILSFTRPGEHEPAPVRLDRLVPDAVELMRATLPATIELRCDIACTDATTLADPTRIDQVLMNLCVNASHAIGEQPGSIIVRLDRTDPPGAVAGGSNGAAGADDGGPQVRIEDLPGAAGTRMQVGAMVATGPCLRLTVSDTGIGMDRDVMSRIFDPFFTTKDVGKGTGLGLSSVQGIVAGHDGAIVVESAPGKGTRFEVYLPEAGADETRAVDQLDKVRGGSEWILFVDDEETLVSLAGRSLGRFGYRVEGVSDARVALELFRADPRKWGVVVTDQTMPHLTGISLAREIAAIRDDIPIILCSGYRPDDAEGETPGVSAFMPKPVRWRELAHRVRRLLDEGGPAAPTNAP